MHSQNRASSMALDGRYQLTVASGWPAGCSSFAGAGGFLTVTGRANTTQQSPDIKKNADSFIAIIIAFTNVNRVSISRTSSLYWSKYITVDKNKLYSTKLPNRVRVKWKHVRVRLLNVLLRCQCQWRFIEAIKKSYELHPNVFRRGQQKCIFQKRRRRSRKSYYQLKSWFRKWQRKNKI